MKHEQFVAWVREIEARLRDPAVTFSDEDRIKLADLLENVLRKWIKARGENDTVVWWGTERTITR